MDENQRQDWWPDNHPDDFSRTSGQNDQPGDPPKNTDATTPDQNSESGNYYSWNNSSQHDSDSGNSYGWNNSTQQDPNSGNSNSWDNNSQQDPNSGNSYNWNNNSQQDPNSGNSYGWNGSPCNNNSGNNWNTDNQPGGYYPNNPPRRSAGGPMVTAALVMGILSVVLMCCGLSYVFGALGIIFALLSRKDGPMDSQAKIGLGLSIAGSVIGTIIVIFAFASNLPYYTELLKEYQNFYYDYSNGKYSDFENFDDFDLDNYDLDDYDFNDFNSDDHNFGSHHFDTHNNYSNYDDYSGYDDLGYGNYNYFKELNVPNYTSAEAEF